MMKSRAALHSLFPEVLAIRATFSDRRYLLAFLPLAAGVAFAYVLLLASIALEVTLPYLGLWVLSRATPQEVLIGAGMGVLLSFVIAVNVYLWRTRSCRPPGLAAAGGTAGLAFSAIGSMICCGTVVPLLLSIFFSGAALASTTFTLRGFLSEYSLVFYGLSFLLLWLSLRIVARRLVASSSLDEEEGFPPNRSWGPVDQDDARDTVEGSVNPSEHESPTRDA